MLNFSGLIHGKSRKRAAAARSSEQPNLYRQWVGNPRSLRWLLRDQDLLTPEDVGLVERWTDRAGWPVKVHDGAGDRPQVVEVFGPEQEDPYALVYRVRHGVQVDEWTGKSWCWPTLGEALDFAASYL